jgi:hypothetical protein
MHSADPRVSARIDRATIDRLTSPHNYLGLAPEMVGRVLAASKSCARLHRFAAKWRLANGWHDAAQCISRTNQEFLKYTHI